MRDGVFPKTIIRMDRIRHMGKGYFNSHSARPGLFRPRARDLTRQLTPAGRSNLTIFAMSPRSTVRKCRGTGKGGRYRDSGMGATLLRRPRLPPDVNGRCCYLQDLKFEVKPVVMLDFGPYWLYSNIEMVEARGVEPLSEDRQCTASTCVADNLSFAAIHAHRLA